VGLGNDYRKGESETENKGKRQIEAVKSRRLDQWSTLHPGKPGTLHDARIVTAPRGRKLKTAKNE